MDFVIDWRFMLITFLGFIVAIFAIKFAIRFDVNKWQESKRQQRITRLRALCPHVVTEFSDELGAYIITSCISSPPGTIALICSLCGFQTLDEHMVSQRFEYWRTHPAQLAEQYRKINKLERKLGLK